MKLASMFGFVMVFLSGAASAQGDEFRLVATDAHSLESEILGETIEVAVSPPFQYNASDAAFPLLLVLDGDVMFGMASEMPRLLSFEGKVPPMIVATVAYNNLNKWIQRRGLDFHSADGGAENFLKTLEEEILPLLKEKYRVDESSVGLYGHSSAGLFAVFAGVQSPGLFTHILATSPSLEEEPEWAESFLPLIEAAPKLPKFYFAADASETAVHEALAPSLAAIVAKSGAELAKYERFDAGSHMSVIPASYVAGLHFLFAPNR